MDMFCFSFSPLIMVVCLLGVVRFSSGENCICPQIPQRHQTEPPADSGKCFQLDERFRYHCIKDYVRKAGTSNLITCKIIEGTVQWTTPSLECIPHPDKPRPPMTETSTSLQSDQILSTTSLPYERYEGINNVHPTSQETLTQTTNTCTTQNFTLSPITDTSSISSEPSTQDNVKAVGISLAVVIVICSIIGLCFVVHRRRSRRNTPQGTTKEMEQLNLPSGQP